LVSLSLCPAYCADEEGGSGRTTKTRKDQDDDPNVKAERSPSNDPSTNEQDGGKGLKEDREAQLSLSRSFVLHRCNLSR